MAFITVLFCRELVPWKTTAGSSAHVLRVTVHFGCVELPHSLCWPDHLLGENCIGILWPFSIASSTDCFTFSSFWVSYLPANNSYFFFYLQWPLTDWLFEQFLLGFSKQPSGNRNSLVLSLQFPVSRQILGSCLDKGAWHLSFSACSFFFFNPFPGFFLYLSAAPVFSCRQTKEMFRSYIRASEVLVHI